MPTRGARHAGVVQHFWQAGLGVALGEYPGVPFGMGKQGYYAGTRVRAFRYGIR